MRAQILITGGFGYVGGRLAQHLAATGSYHLKLTSRRAPEAWPAWSAGMQGVSTDLSDPADLASLCHGVHTVFHLAAANEHACAADPELALEVNGRRSERLLQAAIDAGVRHFVYFSTAHVYGSPLQGRFDEMMPVEPVHPYASSHRVAEEAVLAAQAEDRIKGLVLRLSNGFGAPGDAAVDRWTLIVNDLCRQAVVDGKLVLKSSGLQQRDLVTLHDICRAVRYLIGLDPKRWGDGLFNVGGEMPLTVLEMAQLIAERAEAVLGRRPPIDRPDPQAGEQTGAIDYRIDKLKETGFVLKGDAAAEIDATLQLCRDAFGS